MEMTVEKYETQMVADGKGGLVSGSERKVGQTQVFEFGGPDDHITAAVGGGYVSQWSPDFLQHGLGKNHFFARFYFDKRVAVDIEDPNSSAANRKRKLLFENGFGYLCVPPNFPQDYQQVKALYNAAILEYQAHEKLHPRPDVYQEVMLPAEGNVPARVVKIRAIDIKVGGGMTVSPEQQPIQAEKDARPLSKSELALAKEQARVVKAIRDCSKKGQPFRNPFIKKGGIRLYNVNYSKATS